MQAHRVVRKEAERRDVRRREVVANRTRTSFNIISSKSYLQLLK